ncbi:hypothetical protein EJO69_03585 [Flaviflexus salsibiostraticola]|uniref:Uncharacterized protein n=1 Tax=Flaviflexus salsibiostraticola TaxID=1282737 RepID=A0A3Q8WSU5_9ACTO|nr:hypothetical protein [Flaviflexus salsibiostraticola]AZN29491.1 hypothetical protein EJO69_03585 [Flaviflexus salsibiostraticola]
MSAIDALPGRLAGLVTALLASREPVQIVFDSDVPFDLIARVCRECAAPVSPVAARREQTAIREVTTGASRGYLTTSSAPLPGAAEILRFDGITPHQSPALAAKIQAILDEVWRAGIELPSLAVWPGGQRLPAGSRLQPGRALADLRDLGLGEEVAACLDGPDGGLPHVLRRPCADVIGSWQQLRGRASVGAVVAAPLPSHPTLSIHTARGLAALLGVEYAGELTGNRPPADVEEPASRVRRLASQLRLDPALVDVGKVAGRHVLLVGLRWTEGWTMTVSGQLLLSAGALSVRPFTLSSDSRREPRR